MKLRVEQISMALGLIGISTLLIFARYGERDDVGQKEDFKDNYSIYSLPIPEHLDFAGEAVPLDDPQVVEAFDRELLVNTYWQSQTLLFIKRSARHFPTIEKILKENGVPLDFKYLPLVESGLTPIVSPAGAVGFWQIMESTGKQYGLEIDREVDERYHVEKATRVACAYLKEAYAEFGSWTLAAASYNMGISGLKKQMERQRENSYYALNLNPETARYVYRLLAVKEILEAPDQYGFHVRAKDRYLPQETFTVKVDSSISHVAYLNEKYGINYRILKYYNPWLRMENLPNPQSKVYEFVIPKKASNTQDQPFDPPITQPAAEQSNH
ncbi:lytic transglycosylase domain-containing protein [Croceimicrobium hydrocarbonivorans]|uniref:Lytic transglycosylase domain-containing protein n=1 Tax=Croceimicrobium hydrocarbonivorans TaxID=2761580 RepID=A0A7H0VFX9_9FLAO|nr:lytic transglycosylase domain-containing protein [Croceimicrobium hydrocarbonivorans]QNR24627.1 lytic transglycosylase domain-containing protein [Croceimicrobium hydrocarbonivorans]